MSVPLATHGILSKVMTTLLYVQNASYLFIWLPQFNLVVTLFRFIIQQNRLNNVSSHTFENIKGPRKV